jgi:hypothetical protein
MKNEDLIDTAPVILNEKTRVVFGSLDLGINERGEIVLSPGSPLRHPTLFLSDKGSEVMVEAIFHGRAEISHLGRRPIGVFRFGHQLEIVVTKDEPIKIVVVNNGPEPSNIGASLVDTPGQGETTYHLRKDDLKGREQT